MTLSPHRSVFRIVLTVLALSMTIAAASGEPSDSRLKTIADTKKVKIAYRSDAKPFSFITEQQEPAGYTIDLCKLVVKSLEQQMASALGIEWIPVTTQDRFTAVANGAADMECGSSTVTLGRMKEVDFSTGIPRRNAASSGHGGGVGFLHGLADLRGRKIAVISGTTNERRWRARWSGGT